MAAAAKAEALLSSVAPEAADWARQGTEGFVAALKILSDLTAQELALGLGMVRERVMRPAPGAAEFLGRAVTNLISAQKILLDFAAGESALAANGLEEGLRLRPAFAAVADLVPKGLEAYAETRKRYLDTAAEETREFVESYTEGKALTPATRMANLTRARIEAFIETQKKLLDQFSAQVTLATHAGKEATKVSGRDRSQALIQMAQDSVDKFVDAQKELLHLAVSQLETPKGEKVAPRTSFSELTQKSVRNITTAQKSLLDLMKPPTKARAAGPAAETRKAPRRPRRKK